MNNNALITYIKEWITLNNEINMHQKKIKELKSKKKLLSDSLIKLMENNEVDEFEISNGKLIHKKTKIKNPINKDYLFKTLDTYFEKYPEVDTNDVGNFILENRTTKETSSLIIKENK